MATNETFVSGVHDALVAADKNASGVVSVSDTDVAAQLGARAPAHRRRWSPSIPPS